MFHVAWQGNFESWIQDPLHVRPIAHTIWDPHFGQPAVEAFTRGGAIGPVNISYFLFWALVELEYAPMRILGSFFCISFCYIQLYNIYLIAGWLHLQPKWKPNVSWFKNAESRLNHHLSGLFGVSSLAWTGHLVHVAIPANYMKGRVCYMEEFFRRIAISPRLGPTSYRSVESLCTQILVVIYLPKGAGTAILTLLGGFHPQTQSLWLTDKKHHHLAIAFLFIVAGHMYRTNFGIGHSIKDLLEAHIPPGGRLGRGHKGLYDTIKNSINFQLGLALA